MSLTYRSVTSISWNVIANLTQITLALIRTILLARLLPVEVFGTYGFAAAIVGLSTVFISFGMGLALLRRAPETEDEEQAAAIHFTLTLIFTHVWVAFLVVGAFEFASGPIRTALLVVAMSAAGVQLAETPKQLLVRRVSHRRLALVGVANALITTAVSVVLAWRGVTLWALLANDVVTLVVTIVALYTWHPVWRPRVAWSLPAVRYFLSFGSRNFFSAALWMALDRVDDLWTGVYLGETALGLYSQAYKLATYPRTILAGPMNSVAAGTYAELKHDRPRLSRAFFQLNALLVRSGFLLAGLMALVAPEFIRLVLGSKWMPMLDVFRLMLVFTLLDPLRKLLGYVFAVIGRPEEVIPSLLVRLLVLALGLFVLGPRLGITGVALAVDAMLVVGMAILFWQVKAYVDFSLRLLFAAPSLALVLGISLAGVAGTLPGVSGSDWRAAFVKIAVFSATYGLTLLMIERRQAVTMLAWAGQFVRGKGLSGQRSSLI